MDELTLFHYHIKNPNSSHPPLFLLHGTGGDETDLFPLVEELESRYTIVGLKGNISEQGLARFFQRTSFGVFDQQSIEQETGKLVAFLQTWYTTHHTSATQARFVGYSNGANMILATVLLHPQVINQAALLHPMMPFNNPGTQLVGKRFLVSYGRHDSMVEPAQTHQVIETLRTNGAEVEIVAHNGGHELQSIEVVQLSSFFTRPHHRIKRYT